MTTDRTIEYRITQQLLQRRQGSTGQTTARLAERVISMTAMTAGLLLLGSYLQEMLWVLLAASAVITLGNRKM